MFNTQLFLFNFHVCKWKNVYIKDLNAWRILMNFLCIYFGEKGGGCCTNACICMGTHSQPLLQNRLMDVYETWLRNLVGMKCSWPGTCINMFGYIRLGADPGRGKIGPGEGGFLLQNTSSSDRKATATNWIHSNDLEACVMKGCCFSFHSVVKYFTLESSL